MSDQGVSDEVNPSGPTLSLAGVSEKLGIHYMTAYRYIRTGRLPATKRNGEWEIEAADVELLRIAARGSRGVRTGQDNRQAARSRFPSRLLDRMVAGDEVGAWAVIEDALVCGASPSEIYLELLGPVLSTIGDRWARGDLRVADEHRASSVALRLVGRFGPKFLRPGRKNGTVVLGAAAGELHSIPGSMVADLLRIEGFDVLDLGADSPPESFSDTVKRAAQSTKLVAVLVGATMPSNLISIGDCVGAVIATSSEFGFPEMPVLVGGAAVASEDQALDLGATGYTGPSGMDAVKAVIASLVAKVN